MTYEQFPLGKTDLRSTRLGIGTAYGLSGKDIAWAVENGINYIFWGSFKRGTVPKALKILGPAKRDKINLVVPCYSYGFIKKPYLLKSGLKWSLKRAKTDYADVFQLGWLSSRPSDEVMEVVSDIKEKGLARYVSISTHVRPLAAELIKKSLFDIYMVRYNAANRGAEREIFPVVDPKKDIIINFNSTRWGQLLKKPLTWPEDKYRPKAVDCYRFVLSRPEVSVCLTGAKNRKELKEDLRALELGPLTDEEMIKIKEFGDFVYETKNHPMEVK